MKVIFNFLIFDFELFHYLRSGKSNYYYLFSLTKKDSFLKYFGNEKSLFKPDNATFLTLQNYFIVDML